MNEPEAPHCLNCESPTGEGPYCAFCGQEHTPRILPIKSVIREAVDELFSLDSKLLRTVLPLLFRPGFLTNNYLAGKRAAFVNPLRLYLVCSLLFFLSYVAFPTADGFLSNNENGGDRSMININTGDEDAEEDTGKDSGNEAGNDAIGDPSDQPSREELPIVSEEQRARTDSLAAVWGISQSDAAAIDSVFAISGASIKWSDIQLSDVSRDNTVLKHLRNRRVDLESVRRLREVYSLAGLDSVWTPSDSLVQSRAELDSLALSKLDDFEQFWWVLADQTERPVDLGNITEAPLVGGWIEKRAAHLSRLNRSEAMTLFNRAMLRHLPKTVFFLLPVFALVMKLLYIRRSRRYTEHLIFALHLHSFAFVIMLVRVFEFGWLNVAAGILFTVYTFLAWKRVYRQGAMRTMVKMFIMLSTYSTALAFGLALAALLSVLTM